jgi:chromosomal replication initiation ATPase DnaA
MNTIPHTSHFALVPLSLQAKAERLSKLNPDYILDDVCSVFQQDVTEVKSRSRKTILVFCRQLSCYIARKKTGFTLMEIAATVGTRDYTTVIHGRDVIAGYLKVGDSGFLEKWKYYLHNSKLFTENDFQ